MAVWKPIENLVLEPIWVIKYDLFVDKNGEFCSKEDSVNHFTDCHGWYDSQEDALKVVRHFPRPNTYRVEKVWKRKLI